MSTLNSIKRFVGTPYVRLQCGACKRKLTVRRDDSDPPQAVLVETNGCDKCGKNRDCPQVTSCRAADGSELLKPLEDAI